LELEVCCDVRHARSAHKTAIWDGARRLGCKNGKPVAYGSGDYSKMGRITRYMADLKNPQWRAYLRRRIDLALDAGADGVMYDNNFSDHLLETYRDIYT
jgi:hypothetical protein